MIDLTLDVEQYDCPFIDTTARYDVAFSAVHWEFDATAGELDTRMVVEGADRGALANGLDALADHEGMNACRLLSKEGSVAHVGTTIAETDAMSTVRAHDGYITGPFHVSSGSELWHVGFDHESVADTALSGLERANDFEVVERETVGLADLDGFVRNVGAAMTLIQGCRDLSETERRTLEAAVERGYFETPREATLGDLADEFGVSKTAVSKNLRRAQGKAMPPVTRALEEMGEERGRSDRRERDLGPNGDQREP
jgi:predicted DNA binding protein